MFFMVPMLMTLCKKFDVSEGLIEIDAHNTKTEVLLTYAP